MNADCAGNLPGEAVAYLRDKNIPDLMEHLLHELIVHQPEEPLKFLSKVLSSPVVLKVLLLAPPAGGKKAQGNYIAESFGVVKIDALELLEEEKNRNTKLGKEIENHMLKGELIPDSVMENLVTTRLQQEDACSRGWLLVGFPRTRNQALALQTAGCLPQALISITLSPEVAAERTEGIRIDPVTSKQYHLAFDPPEAPEVLSRLQKPATATREQCLRRLAGYNRNIAEVEGCYRSCLHRVDGNRDKSTVAAEITEILKQIVTG
eukprot:TRINITY_DN7116_c3_g1_i1.p1 TRINITY_DN7116_c3_g1~~TRINITY_DN7116_c3_g1_i1.p1  ORF type:complete len:287 (+),score=49.61 TRINITY_DN7116_c3_g1_i1:71-862(+)